jgi:hypothetical protein
MFIGIRALRRDRVLYRQELAARIAWHRHSADTVTLLGAREVVPIVATNGSVPEGLQRDAPDVVFDPADDRVMIGMSDSNVVVEPLASGGEANYRFQSGDTTEIAFTDGPTIRLIELRVTPRRQDFRLMAGALWIDAATGDVVQTVFRPARAFDLERDLTGKDHVDVPGFLQPIRVEANYVTIEYALWEGRWWLPRLIAFDGVATVGAVATLPLRYERTYSEYEVEGDTTIRVPPSALPAAVQRSDSGGTRDSIHVTLAGDSASLLVSDALPPSLGDEAPVGLSQAELNDLTALVRTLAAQSGEGPGARVAARRRLARYKRVEGLSIGAQGGTRLGRAQLGAAGRMGLADEALNGELGIAPNAGDARWRVTIYRRLAVANPWTDALGVGNSLNALLLGRDDGAYYRAAGAEVTVEPPISAARSYSVRVFWERQTQANSATQASVAHWFEPAHLFPANIPAPRADELGVQFTLRALKTDIFGDVSIGTFRFARLGLTTRRMASLPAGLLAAAEAAAGTSTGPVPLQSLWYLGGPATLRGYGGLAAVGAAFWRGRVELATASPAARAVVFADAGWAGLRGQAFTARPLIGVGAGMSLLDGLLRIDLARALRAPVGWRFDCYIDAIL